MTASNITSHSPAQIKALHNQLTALQRQLAATEAQVTVLRQDNNRLEAALAVERAARDPDALRKARHHLHLVTFKLLRALHIFDRLHLPRPDLNARPDEFVTDEFLAATVARVETHFARKFGHDAPAGEPRPPLHVAECHRSGENDTETDDLRGVREGPGAPTVRQRPLVDASNPPAEMMRLLIGATSVEVLESPPRIRIKIANEDGTREAAFFLTCHDGIMTATRDSVKFDQPELPQFLNQSPMEFEVAQAPNFLILFMGSILDFSVEPRR